MPARLQSFLLHGVDALPCEVEVDLDDMDQKERETVVGLPDAAVRESIERVRSALGNGGYATPRGRLLINLAPADVRKEGTLYDLPIAVGLLQTQGVVPMGAVDGAPDVRRTLIAGELALDGRVRPIRGAIAMASLAAARQCAAVIVPAENAQEAAVVESVEVFGVRTLTEVVGLLTGLIEAQRTAPPDVAAMLESAGAQVDFSEVRGQEAVKRALVVAAAGSHNILVTCPSPLHRPLDAA
jgi:magnesium chelatase family protein